MIPVTPAWRTSRSLQRCRACLSTRWGTGSRLNERHRRTHVAGRAAVLSILGLAVLPAVSAAEERPALHAEELVAQGARTLVVVEPRGARECRLVAVAPTGK